ncbi:MAG: hypothetical protein DU429_06410 [Candidatus Tokpelaia sp.]|nr:MAG: hypothetical protein DU430_01790 [Candidatus Tokpelaia sp.]KAA6206348.1 MAG: hypothetical protein DU429_06410 [Candidatus Tokpelaia sp.]
MFCRNTQGFEWPERQAAIGAKPPVLDLCCFSTRGDRSGRSASCSKNKSLPVIRAGKIQFNGFIRARRGFIGFEPVMPG